jgi:hypothetical protein
MIIGGGIVMKVEKLERLCLGVPDLEEGIKSFNNIFGLEFEFVGEVVLPNGAKIKAAISQQGFELVEVPGKAIHFRSFHFKAKDLEEAKSWVQDNGVKVLSEFSVGQMDEVVLDLFGMRAILVNYPGDDPIAAAKGEV